MTARIIDVTHPEHDSIPTLVDVLDQVDADSEGSQVIVRGDSRYRVIKEEPQEQEAEHSRQRKYRDLKDFLLNGPRFDGVEIERDPDTGRDIEL